MIYDKPAQVVWVAQLTATGLLDNGFIKIIDDTQPLNNVINVYEDKGKVSFNVSNYNVSTNIQYSITDSNLQPNQSEFNWYFSAYKAPIYDNSAMVAVNYFNNYTSNDIQIVINSGSDVLYPPFYLEVDVPNPSPTVQKVYTVPAGSVNFPIPVWVNPNSNQASTTITCQLLMNPDIFIYGTLNYVGVEP